MAQAHAARCGAARLGDAPRICRTGRRGPDIGLLFGGSATFFRYGFRKVPYSSKWRFRLGYATSAQTLNGDILGDIRLENSTTYFTILVRGSGIATLNFYGFGNETPETEPASFYRVRQQQYTLQPGINFGLTKGTTLTLSALEPLFRHR